MPNSTRSFTLRSLFMLSSFVACQSAWAQPVPVTDVLALYVPVQDQLCNYCQDYSSSTTDGSAVLTRYQPGSGYPNLAGSQARLFGEAALEAKVLLVRSAVLVDLSD